MCGILVTYEPGNGTLEQNQFLIQAIQDRGPDFFRVLRRSLPHDPVSGITRNLAFASSVLALRGETLTPQPLEDDSSGSLFCWNGEAWSFASVPIVQENDAVFVFRILLSCICVTHDDSNSRFTSVKQALSSIIGPFSFVFFDAARHHLYYGRDSLGRRSLVTCQLSDGSFMISSVACGIPDAPWEEVPAGKLHFIDFSKVSRSRQLYRSLASHYCCSETVDEGRFPNVNQEERPSTHEILHNEPALVRNLLQVFETSIRTRLIGFSNTLKDRSTTETLGILFSGGLDCTLIARLVHRCAPDNVSIDLLNVAFENPRLSASSKGDSMGNQNLDSPYERCPDRITARRSYQELVQVCSSRRWRFVTINVPYAEVQSHRKRILWLMNPHNTEMDYSISLALYFAARGIGLVVEGSNDKPYHSQARVLFSGLGADELFGGYGRHAVAWKRGGNAALAQELELDFRRLGARNLGRDDRVMASWGKEIRYPFLDEGLVIWALNRPAWEKCDFDGCAAFSKNNAMKISECSHNGDKTLSDPDLSGTDPAKGLLRSLAQHLGLHIVAKEKKRAIQFGARTAKMQSTKSKGTDLVRIDSEQ